MEAIDKLRDLSKKLEDPYFIKEFEEGFEKFLKERDMKIYHVETQQDYDALMSELEEKGCEWRSGEKLTDIDEFSTHGKDTYVYEERCEISISSGDYFKKYHSDVPVIEYKAKAKGENMTQEEMKQKEMKRNILNILNRASDVSVAVKSFYRDIKFKMKKSTVEADLQEAKSSAKKLIEKIDEYLESQKLKFKVGDYVALHAFHKEIAKIEKIYGDKLHGLWYDTESESIRPDYYIGGGTAVKHATPTEIAEYEVALNFRKNGRKPFEVKEGDLIEYPNGQNIMIYHPDCFSKVDFLNDGFKLIKTAEEVNEWLKGE